MIRCGVFPFRHAKETRMTLAGTDTRRTGAGSRVFALLAFALAFGALAWLQPLPAGAQTETRLRLSLDRAIDGTAAPLFVALDKGYFKAEGLEVSIDAAANPQEAITRLTLVNNAPEPSHDMSLGDLNTLVRYRDQNFPTGIKAVYIVHDKPAYAIVARKSRGVQAPKDVEGKRLGAPAADPTSQFWPLVVKLNGIDASKVTLLNIGPLLRAPMLAAGEVDGILGSSFTSFVDLKDRSVPADDIVMLLLADYGLMLYGSAFLASAKFQADQPQAIRSFLRAYTLGLRDTMADPAAAIDAVLSRMQSGRKEVELERLQIVLAQNIAKFDPKAETAGGVDPTRLLGSLEQIGSVYAYKTKLKPDDIFDARYLPPPPVQRLQPKRKKK
jgi:NitT/TauT family transport system substrate-binding protein